MVVAFVGEQANGGGGGVVVVVGQARGTGTDGEGACCLAGGTRGRQVSDRTVRATKAVLATGAGTEGTSVVKAKGRTRRLIYGSLHTAGLRVPG
jgi:hypothetical protein